MNRVLKYAWYQLIVIVAAMAWAGVFVWVVLTWWRENEFSALIPLAPLALVHFYRVFFPLKAGEIAFDERDEAIMNRATKFSFIVFWYMFILSCIIPLVVIGNGTIHVSYLGGMLFTLALILRIIWSISVIIQYGRTCSEDDTDTMLKGETA
jgi:membrane protein CcdC involved in cytochrome C biogenesis